MRVVIIEDEKPSARRLKRMVEAEGLTVDAILHSVEESVAYFAKAKEPDLILLDIRLGDGLSFDIFEQVKLNAPIIFTTAYDEYALQAFKLNSIDYLLKPIDQEELQETLSKMRQDQQNKVGHIDIESIRKLLGNPIDKKYRKRYSAKIGEHIKIFPLEEIKLFFSEHKTSHVHLKNGRNYPISETLEQIESELNPDEFFRISRKAILRAGAINDVISYTNSRLEIRIDSFDETRLIVSRERVPDFKQWLAS